MSSSDSLLAFPLLPLPLLLLLDLPGEGIFVNLQVQDREL